jgi:putative transposase
MQVQRSGYYKYLKTQERCKNGIKTNLLIIEVKLLSKLSRNSYGSRQIAKNLQAKGYKVGRYQARTLMRKAGVVCKQRRRYRVTTMSNHSRPIAINILNRQFSISKPNRVWVADITYLWTHEGWLYIAAVLDLFSRRVVGWAMANHMREDLIAKALQMAVSKRKPEHGLIHHSDRGSQYASHEYQQKLKRMGIVVSMSRKGNCWDNAVMERFFGSLKSERTDKMKYFTRSEAMADVVDYIEMFYNSQRLHSTLGYVTPLQYEQNAANYFS